MYLNLKARHVKYPRGEQSDLYVVNSCAFIFKKQIEANLH